MKRSRVAKRYAQALFETALEKKQLERVEADLKLLDTEYRQSESFRQLIESPVIANPVKQQTFEVAFQQHLQPLTFRFVSLLIGKNREMHLPQIIIDFSEMLDAHRGIIRGDVYSVVPLSEGQLRELKKRLDQETGKSVILRQHIEESLLGGVMVRINDMIYDASLRNKLSKLRQNLIESR
ncbi:MAG: F0F1 ATP synthase subunit delta [Calditrichaeota bacterium]|nr:F0F1 ATP synthase subunit delta [Calditrichota bacterium]MCB9088735.1 F0F1 ATP synthase subunit delta [Calditrichia bacterium]